MAKNAGSNVTRDHDEIRRWAEARGAEPSCVRGTGDKNDIGLLRLDFPGYTGETSLEHISWEDWFAKFHERGLALLYQETTADGEQSNFNKIVSAGTAAEVESSPSRGARKAAKSAAHRPSSRKHSGSSGVAKKTASGKSAAKKSWGAKKSAAAAKKGRKNPASKSMSATTAAKQKQSASAAKKKNTKGARKSR